MHEQIIRRSTIRTRILHVGKFLLDQILRQNKKRTPFTYNDLNF